MLVSTAGPGVPVVLVFSRRAGRRVVVAGASLVAEGGGFVAEGGARALRRRAIVAVAGEVGIYSLCFSRARGVYGVQGGGGKRGG